MRTPPGQKAPVAFHYLPLPLLQQNYERNHDHDRTYDREDVAGAGILKCRALFGSAVGLQYLDCGV